MRPWTYICGCMSSRETHISNSSPRGRQIQVGTPSEGTPDTRFLVWAVIATQFAPPFMFSGVAVALPSMGHSLGAGARALGLVETLFLAGSVAFLLPVGRYADARDKRALYKLGLLSFALSSLLIALSSSVPFVLCIRFLQGLTSAVFAVTGPAILAELVPPDRRGRAYGGSLGAIYGGLTLGPIIAGFLIDHWGWRSVFLASAGLILVGYIAVRLLMPPRAQAPQASKVHLPSTLLVVASILALVAGSASIGQGFWGYVGLLAGVAFAAAFVILQRRIAQPLVDLGMLQRNATMRNALFIQMLLYMNAFSSIFLLSIYMQVVLGHAAKTSGQVIALGSVLMALVAPLAGRLADRYPPRILTSVGVAGVGISAWLAIAFDAHSVLRSIAAMLAIQGVGFALFSSPNMTVIMNSVALEASSMASALSAKARSLGMVFGMLFTTILLSLHLGDAPVAEHPLAFLPLMHLAFVCLALLTSFALACSLLDGVMRRGRARSSRP